ncbi:MAG: hypothetical protein QOG01_2447 [Pseudonocardiales bacterium]|jgi:hypothetical protein|nr:hypothetical protein [Pseudonocardiales bacterium]
MAANARNPDRLTDSGTATTETDLLRVWADLFRFLFITTRPAGFTPPDTRQLAARSEDSTRRSLTASVAATRVIDLRGR